MSEYKKYHASEKMKKERALRNKNRRAAARDGRVKKEDGNPKNNSKKNLRVVKAKNNRVKQ